MKRSTLFTAVAALALVGPFALTPALAQRAERPEQSERNDQDRTTRGGVREADRRPDARAEDHRDRREAWRDDRREARWDADRHNGYYQNGRWTYGPPPADRYGASGFELGYRPWAIGQNLGYYSDRFSAVDYRTQQLPRPARGERWVRDDRGDFLRVDSTGRVRAVMISGAAPRDRHQSWRDSSAGARWDDARHNGYYRDGQWTYGPPPQDARDVVYGYQPWQRGQRLGYYRTRYQEVDYRSNTSLRAPSRGQHWVRTDGGDYLLANIATGLIGQVILGGAR